MTTSLNVPGPAQSDWLVHFCSRPPGTGKSWEVDADIANLSPAQKLEGILWDGALRGSPAFGARGRRVVCLSESPTNHLNWLISERGFPAWGLVLRRQWVYDVGGGPVWYARSGQFWALPDDQRAWAVRLETGSSVKSEWLHEREWRIPIGSGFTAQAIPREALLAVIIADPNWTPLRTVNTWTGYYLTSSGSLTTDQTYYPDIRPMPQLPALWPGLPRWWWNPQTAELTQLPQ